MRFTHPQFLWFVLLAWAWVLWLFLKSDVQIAAWRRWTALFIRFAVVTLVLLAIAGLQWLKPQEGMNVFFLLDRSDSIPSPQQEAARKFVNQAAAAKKKEDKAGVLVFGTDAAIESSANDKIDLQKINAVVGSERSDIAAAIRLGSAAFPETGQKRLVLLSDGNENLGDAQAAITAARALGVTVDVVPLGMERGNDVSVQKLAVPSRLKKGQTFEVKIFVQADQAQNGIVRLYRNEQPLGEQQVQLTRGKNLFAFPQTLSDAGFYSYSVYLDAAGDKIPQNNRATSFASVRGDPRVLIVSSDPEQDGALPRALRNSRIEAKLAALSGFPSSLAELQSYDAVFISNVAAGDLGLDAMRLIESAVRDFGVGLVCVGGEQTYAAGAYRGTPLETTLPVNMELDSKKVLPKGAVALVMHGMEFMNGNQIARDCALGVLDALGPQDEMGVVLWDGHDRWLFPLQPVGNKQEPGRLVAGMNQGDLPDFQNVMSLAHQGLKKSTSNLKHMIVFSDGDPAAPTPELMQNIVNDRITVTTVLIAGHAGPDTMVRMAEQGHGRFYNVQNPSQLPQIFVKEAAVILKSAIFEEPFRPKLVSGSEVVRGIGAEEYPALRGYVSTTPKPRAEVPIVSDKGDPILAHWQFGLGRSIAFTSDAKAKWARDWLAWPKYRQFWSQAAQWALRRIESADFSTEVSVDKGKGQLTVEAMDEQGNYRNFLNLQTVLVSPKGERQTIRLEQTAPGHYEAKFPTREVGSYLLNLMETQNGKLVASQVVGASVDYSPEFNAPEPNINLLQRFAGVTGGKMLDWTVPTDNPFLHDRRKTFQPRDLWEWLLKAAVLLFVLDVAIRRIQIDQEDLQKALAVVRSWVFFWRGRVRPVEADQSLVALLARRDQVRAERTAETPPPELFQPIKPVQPKTRTETRVQETIVESGEAEPPQTEQPSSTTGRLLEAKRKARRRRD